MSEWISCEFGSLYAEPSRNGLTKPKRVRGHGVKFVNMGEIFQYDRLKNFQCDRVPLSENEKFALLKNDDLLIARQSLVLAGAGKCSIFLGDFEEVAFESHIIRVRLDQTKANPLFYYYLFRSPQGRALIEAIVEQGAGASGVRSSDLQSLMIPYTSLPQQKAIAHILGSLDDKIELNRRMNETLEAMARAIFKDWFVDFGPTRAKIEGRAPYLPEPIWSLFPDAINEETGLPVGWENKSIGDLLESSIGGDWGKEQIDGKHTELVAIIRGTDFSSLKNGNISSIPNRYVDKKKLDKRLLHEGDILLEVSGGSPTQPTGRSLYIASSIFDRFNTALIPASFCRRLRPLSLEIASLLNIHLDILYKEGGTWKYQNQSTGISNFQTTYFLESEMVVLPSRNILKNFHNIVHPILNKMFSNENMVLAELRDRLLPKLMSGQIRVKDAEKLVEEVL